MNLIVVAARDWGIGCDGGLLFNLPDDMKFFRDTTNGKVVVMGRNTLLSLPGGKPLKNRKNIVLTTNKNFNPEGCTVCNSFEELFNELKKHDSDNIFIIGGGEIYNYLYPYCQKAYITKVDAVTKADIYLHNFDEDENWKLIFTSEKHINNEISFTFNTYENLNIKIF